MSIRRIGGQSNEGTSMTERDDKKNKMLEYGDKYIKFE